MKVLKALAVLPLIILLGQCEQKPGGPSPYAFDMTLEVTPAAAELMKAKNSHFVVAASYFGRPRPETRAQANAQGRIKLGYEQIGMAPGATKVHLPATNFDAGKLGAINGDPQVMVIIFSAAEVGARDDLIHCKTYFGIIKTAQAQPPVVACDVNRP